MDTRILALFWSALALTLSAIYLLRPAVLVRLKHWVAENEPMAFLYGMLSLLLGLATIVIQPWGSSATSGIVSLFGWLAFSKGALLVGWPEVVRRPRFETRLGTTRIALVAVAILSGYVLFSLWMTSPTTS